MSYFFVGPVEAEIRQAKSKGLVEGKASKTVAQFVSPAHRTCELDIPARCAMLAEKLDVYTAGKKF